VVEILFIVRVAKEKKVLDKHLTKLEPIIRKFLDGLIVLVEDFTVLN
jgi:hypothetical protein